MLSWTATSRALFVAILPPAALAIAAPWIHVRGIAAVTIAYAVASSTIIAATSGARLEPLRPPRTAVGFGVLGAALMAAGLLLSRIGHTRAPYELASGFVGTLGVLTLGTTLGASVGLRIQHAGHLLAVALASSAADIWSVHAPEGVTHAVVHTRDVALQRMFTVSAAVPPFRFPEAVIGLGDVIFVALYLATAERHELSRPRMIAALACGLLAAGAIAIVLARPIPALPAIGAAVVLFTPQARVIQRHDRFPTAVAAALLVAAIGRVLLLRR